MNWIRVLLPIIILLSLAAGSFYLASITPTEEHHADEGHDEAGLTSQALADELEVFAALTLTVVIQFLYVLGVAVHLARPYIIRVLKKFTLRLGADIWWLGYILIRDGLMIATFILGLTLFFPHLMRELNLPLFGTLSMVLLLWALVVKLLRDADDDPQAFRWVTYLLVAGAALYTSSFIFGTEATGLFGPLSSFLVTQDEPRGSFRLALASFYFSLALMGATAVFVLYRVLEGTRRATVVEATGSEETKAGD